MSLLDWGIGELTGAYGSKPKVPTYTPEDTTKGIGDTISGNLQNLSGAEKLAGGINQFNYDQLQKMLGQAIPGFGDIQKSISGNIASELKGEIPQDVQDQIMRSSAFKSLRGGYGGGGMSDALTARDLGLTSLNLTNQGLDSATKWLAASRSATIPGQFDVSSMFLSPQQKIGIDIGEKQYGFQAQWLKNQIKAMPSPSSVALAGAASQDLGMFSSLAGSAVGGAAGGGGGGGGGSL